MKHEMIARRQAMRDRLGRYARSRILPALGLAGGEFELEVPAEGTRSIVLFLNTARGRFLVRCIGNIARAAQTVLVTRHLVARGAPVPRLLYLDFSPVTFLRTGSVVLVEECIDGQNLYELERSDERLRAAARALARLHGIRRASWGPPFVGLGRRGGYFAFLNRRLQRRLADVVAYSPEFAAALGDPVVADWLAAQHAAAAQPGGYSLCHLRVTDTNVLFTPGGEVYLIDVVTARYGNHAIDLERALYRWCNHVARREEVFLDEYFRAFTGVTRAQWQEGRDYFRVSFHLTQAYRAAKEMRGFRETRGEKYKKTRHRRRLLVRHLLLLADAMAAARVAPPGEAVLRLRAEIEAAALSDQEQRRARRRRK